MSLFKAGRNYFLRKGSNALFNRDIKTAKDNAYSKTGKKMKNANKHGYYIDGSATYKKYLSANLKKAKEKKELREKFISDL